MNVQSYELIPPIMSSKAHAMSICRNGAVESLSGGSQSRVMDEASTRRLASLVVAITRPTDDGFIMNDVVTLYPARLHELSTASRKLECSVSSIWCGLERRTQKDLSFHRFCGAHVISQP